MRALRRLAAIALSPRWQEVALVALLWGVSVALAGSELVLEGGDYRRMDAGGYVLMTAAVLPILIRRSHPVAMLALTTGFNLAYHLLEYPPIAGSLAIVVGVFSVAARRPRPVSAAAAGLTAGALAAAVAIDSTTPESPVDYVANVAVIAIAWLVGDQVREGRARVDLAEERADRAERERELVAERRVAEERLRIARELHDVIAHSLSAIVVRAGATRRVSGEDPAALRDALEMVERTARDALADARGVLGGLRGPDGVGDDRSPQPGLRQLDGLVEASRQAGVPTDLAVEGAPRAVPPGAELSAYRIIQEALTNVRKHAGPGARARVRVVYRPEAIEVTVEDDGRGARDPDTPAPGHGLLGMRERAVMHGGRLRAAPRPDGGFTAHALIPTGEGGVTLS